MLHAALIPVLYNRCYGGFCLSDVVIRAYNAECPDRLPLHAQGADAPRTDRQLAAIVTRLREVADGPQARLGLCWVDERFEAYVNIGEYDGYERVTVDFQRYQLDAIRRIAADTAGIDPLQRILCVLAEAEPIMIGSDDDDTD